MSALTIKPYLGPEAGDTRHPECDFLYSEHGTIGVVAGTWLVCPTADGPFSGKQVTEVGWQVLGQLMANAVNPEPDPVDEQMYADIAMATFQTPHPDAVIDAALLQSQYDWSVEAFGPGPRTMGITDHLMKEIAEIRAEPEDLEEWIDVIILGFNGANRLCAEHGIPVQAAIDKVIEKHAKNATRKWPDWRTAEPDKAIEHVRDEA